EGNQPVLTSGVSCLTISIIVRRGLVSEATITSKGQVTIPVEVRRALGLNPQDKVTFTPMPDGTVVLRAKTKSVMDLKGLLKPSPGTRVSIDDMRMDQG